MFRRRKRRNENEIKSQDSKIPRRGQTKRKEKRQTKRTKRRKLRREFLVKLTGNLKWVMLGLAVVAVIMYLWFGSPLGLIKGLF